MKYTLQTNAFVTSFSDPRDDSFTNTSAFLASWWSIKSNTFAKWHKDIAILINKSKGKRKFNSNRQYSFSTSYCPNPIFCSIYIQVLVAQGVKRESKTRYYEVMSLKVTWSSLAVPFTITLCLGSASLTLCPRAKACNFKIDCMQCKVASACLLTKCPRIRACSLIKPFSARKARRACRFSWWLNQNINHIK